MNLNKNYPIFQVVPNYTLSQLSWISVDLCESLFIGIYIRIRFFFKESNSLILVYSKIIYENFESTNLKILKMNNCLMIGAYSLKHGHAAQSRLFVAFFSAIFCSTDDGVKTKSVSGAVNMGHHAGIVPMTHRRAARYHMNNKLVTNINKIKAGKVLFILF